MNNLFWIFWGVFSLVVCGSTYILYGLLSERVSEARIERRKRQGEESKEKEIISTRDQKILKLEGELDSFKKELENARSYCAELQNEIALAKKKEAEFKDELERRGQ